MFIKPLS